MRGQSDLSWADRRPGSLSRAGIDSQGRPIDRFSRLAAANGWGGLAGHYLLATDGLVNRHHRLGQAVGTGFADSRRCLYREVAREVDWIFSNRAARMQAICNGEAGGQ